MERQKGFVAWIALVVAAIALALGWTAFNRTGTDVEAIVEEKTRQSFTGLEQRMNAAEQAIRDSASRALETGQNAIEEENTGTTSAQ